MSPQVGTSSVFADLEVEIVANAPIGQMTWYGIGGRADFLVRPRNIAALAQLVRRCERTQTPLRVLGAGANLLVADEGVDGIVVQLNEPAFTDIAFNPQGEVHVARAMAGADMMVLVNDTTRRGLAGLGHMAGIPASIGGALRMNAGGAFGSIGDAVLSVTCLTRRGEVVTYAADELRFEYRHTNIPDQVILGAMFRLTPSDPIALRKRVKEIFAFKKSTQPLADHSAGCTFKNPIDPVTEQRVSAGKLIDEAGLKGTRKGGATISRHHANFIVTGAGATASDVLQLLELARKRVFEHSGMRLEPEIIVWRRGQDEPAHEENS